MARVTKEKTEKPNVVMIEVREYKPGGGYKTVWTTRFYGVESDKVVRWVQRAIKRS